MVIAACAQPAPRHDGYRPGRRRNHPSAQSPETSVAVGRDVASDPLYGVAFDELLFLARRLAKRVGGEPVDLPQARPGYLVQQRERALGEELAVTADAPEC